MIWVLLLFGGYAGICFGLAHMYRHPSRLKETMPYTFREIEVAGSPVWVIGPENPKASFVMCHGYGGSRHTWTELAERLAKRGYASYLPSMPAHGGSPKQEVGFGVTESELALAVARQAKGKVIGVGVSLGGAAIWLACDKDPTAFDAVCTESAFPRLNQATDAFLDRALPAGRIAFAPVRWIAEWQSGVKAGTINPIRGAEKMRGKPVLVMHGDADKLFPLTFGRELAEASGTELWCVPKARHAYCFDVGPTEYTNRLIALAEQAQN